MHEERLHRLVAVDEHGRPIGVISAMDFVTLAAEETPQPAGARISGT
jgi:hypothetical protein